MKEKDARISQINALIAQYEEEIPKLKQERKQLREEIDKVKRAEAAKSWPDRELRKAEILRLYWDCGKGTRRIADIVGMSQHGVYEIVRKSRHHRQ
jgi:DNA-directed RNA polymerase specialized sigma subunit